MKEKLEDLNRHAFNNFKLRIGKFYMLLFPQRDRENGEIRGSVLYGGQEI